MVHQVLGVASGTSATPLAPPPIVNSNKQVLIRKKAELQKLISEGFEVQAMILLIFSNMFKSQDSRLKGPATQPRKRKTSANGSRYFGNSLLVADSFSQMQIPRKTIASDWISPLK